GPASATGGTESGPVRNRTTALSKLPAESHASRRAPYCPEGTTGAMSIRRFPRVNVGPVTRLAPTIPAVARSTRSPAAIGWNVEAGWSSGPNHPESVRTNRSFPVRVSNTALPGTGVERVALSQYPFTNAWNGVASRIAGHQAVRGPSESRPTGVPVSQEPDTLYVPGVGWVRFTPAGSMRPRFRNVPI